MHGIVHSKVKFDPFATHPDVDAGSCGFFLIHVTVRCHKWKEIHPVDAYGSHGL